MEEEWGREAKLDSSLIDRVDRRDRLQYLGGRTHRIEIQLSIFRLLCHRLNNRSSMCREECRRSRHVATSRSGAHNDQGQVQGAR